jgi:hypothetical protein
LIATPPLDDAAGVEAAGVDVELELSLELPHPAAARANAAHSRSAIRLIPVMTPPSLLPS